MTRRPLAVVLGAGAVGCGVVLPWLRETGHDVVLVTRTPASAHRLGSGRVAVRVLGPEQRTTTVRATATLHLGQGDALHRALLAADVVVLATAPDGLHAAATVLRGPLAERHRPVDVLCCDDRLGAGRRLRTLLGDDPGVHRGHGCVGVLVDCIVARRPHPDGSLLLLREARARVAVEARALRTPVRLGREVGLVEDLDDHVLRRLYGFSTGHAAAAYVGAWRGHDLVGDALRDPVVHQVVHAAVREGRDAVARLTGDAPDGPRDVERVLARYATPGLDDTVVRVGRDPARKLAGGDRICGPARLAVATGQPCGALAVVAAIALLVHLRSGGRTTVPAGALASTLWRLSGLPLDHPFPAQVVRAAAGLQAGADPLELATAPVPPTVRPPLAPPRPRTP